MVNQTLGIRQVDVSGLDVAMATAIISINQHLECLLLQLAQGTLGTVRFSFHFILNFISLFISE